MNIESVVDEIRKFQLPQELLAQYQHCGAYYKAYAQISDVIGTWNYPYSLYPAYLLPFAKYFDYQRVSEQTFHIFANNLKFVSSFCYYQLFSDNPEQRRQTRFALAKRFDFRAECEEFLVEYLQPSFYRVIDVIQNYEELRIMIRMALYFCLENDARRERGAPMTAVDEFIDQIRSE